MRKAPIMIGLSAVVIGSALVMNGAGWLQSGSPREEGAGGGEPPKRRESISELQTRRPAAEGALEARDVERPALLDTSTLKPGYPNSLRKAQEVGVVEAWFVVDTAGRVEPNTLFIEWYTHPQLVWALQDALPGLRYRPAQLRGQNVRQREFLKYTWSPLLLDPSEVVHSDFQVDKKVARAPGFTEPAYPSALKGTGKSGRALVQFVIDTNGRVEVSTFKNVLALRDKNFHLVPDTTKDPFVEAVREALPGMRFIPAEAKGRKVKLLFQEEFRFQPPG